MSSVKEKANLNWPRSSNVLFIGGGVKLIASAVYPASKNASIVYEYLPQLLKNVSHTFNLINLSCNQKTKVGGL